MKGVRKIPRAKKGEARYKCANFSLTKDTIEMLDDIARHFLNRGYSATNKSYIIRSYIERGHFEIFKGRN
jgi:hypothetical protein